MALLQFRAWSGDIVLAEHLQTAHHHRSAFYTSKTIQNEVIDISGSILCDTILAAVRTAHFFSITVDEATDAGNDEQFIASIGYIKPRTEASKKDFWLSVSVWHAWVERLFQITSFSFLHTSSSQPLIFVDRLATEQEWWQERIREQHQTSKKSSRKPYTHTVLHMP